MTYSPVFAARWFREAASGKQVLETLPLLLGITSQGR
jgi:hypothetical protein